MKIIRNEKNQISEIVFNDNDDQKLFWEAFNKEEEEVTIRTKAYIDAYANSFAKDQDGATARAKIFADANVQIITARSIGSIEH